MAKENIKQRGNPRKTGIERYNRIIEAAESLILEANSLRASDAGGGGTTGWRAARVAHYFFDSIVAWMALTSAVRNGGRIAAPAGYPGLESVAGSMSIV